VDLLDWFRGRRPWAQLERLIDGLPAHSRYVAALLDDPDVAADLAEVPTAPRPMSLVGFDPVVARLTDLIDAVNANTAATIAAAGVDPPTIDPMPRPETELDRARNRVRLEARNMIADMMTGRVPMDMAALLPTD
jgi:hypothetical protein